jgi:hypothetical protein
LASVIDSDKILVMNEGKAVEFDHPFKLLVKSDFDRGITNLEGEFAKMVQSTGEQTAQALFENARRKYFFRLEQRSFRLPK